MSNFKSVGLYIDRDAIIANAGIPAWIKVATLTYADFATSGNSNTIPTGYSLPPRALIHSCQVIVTIPFSGGTLSNYTMDVKSATFDYSPIVFSLITGFTDNSGAGLSAPVSVGGYESLTTPTVISAIATSSGDTLDHATAGSVDIYLLVSVLP